MVCDALRDATAPHGLTFGPDPSTHSRCTLGGMIGNDACGTHSVACGKTVDNLPRAGRAHLRAGERRRVAADRTGAPRARPRCARSGSGDADDDPGRLPRPHPPGLRLPAAPAAARARLRPGEGPGRHRGHLCGAAGGDGPAGGVAAAPRAGGARLPDVYDAADDVPAILRLRPPRHRGHGRRRSSALRATARPRRRRGPARGRRLAATWRPAATGRGARARPRPSSRRCAPDATGGGRGRASRPTKALWRIREDGAGLAARLAGRRRGLARAGRTPRCRRSGSPPTCGSSRAAGRHGLPRRLYGHFGDGCVHVRIDFDLATARRHAPLPGVPGGGRRPGRRARRLAVGRARRRPGPRASCCRGCTRRRLIDAFAEFKAHLGPGGPAQPGPSSGPRPSTPTCAWSPGCRRCATDPELAFPHDRGSFARATRRCVGVGKCVGRPAA